MFGAGCLEFSQSTEFHSGGRQFVHSVSGNSALSRNTASASAVGRPAASASTKPGSRRSGARLDLTARSSTRIAAASGRAWTGSTAIAPKRRVSASSARARPSARQISVSTPFGLSRREATPVQPDNCPWGAAWARRRPACGEALCRSGSLNGGFISTRSAEAAEIPAAENSRAGASTSSSTARARSDKSLRAILSRAKVTSAGSISTSVTSRRGTRNASARPAAPTPANRSTARSPGLAWVAAASRIASWPTRWPWRGCRSASRPPSTASCVVSATRSSRIGTKLAAKARRLQQAARGGGMLLGDQDAARQNAERAFEHAHVLVEHVMGNSGALQQGTDRRNQHRVIGANQLAHTRLPADRAQSTPPGEPDPAGPTLAAWARRFYAPAGRLSKYAGNPGTPASPGSSMSRSHSRPENALAVVIPFESQPASIDPLTDLVNADMDRVNATILSRTGSEVTMIPEIANHLIGSGGKRLRPMLTVAMAQLVGYRGDGHVKLAASVEFMHTATLLHDDVVDESEMRRGRLAARMLWGNEASVLVGDFLLGQAFKMMVEVGSLRALEILSCAAAVIAEGEVMQLAAAKNTATTEDEYLAVIRAKTAELFAAACEVGPVLAGRPKAEQAACRSLGMNVGDDFREGKITLPVVLSFRRGSEHERAFWKRTLEEGDVREKDLETALGLMVKHRALEDTIKRAQHYGAIAKDALALFPDAPMKAALSETVDFCIRRTQ